MHKTLIAVAAAAVAAACSTPPKPTVPDGANRKAVNTEARIADYRTRTGEEQVASAERSALTRQVAYLQGEILKLKTYVIQLSTIASTNDGGLARALPPAAAVSQASARVRPDPKVSGSAAIDTESFEIREGAVVFRVMQPFAKAEFNPSVEFKSELLNRARVSARIDIRGRTDAAVDNNGDRVIAQRRALRARSFLLENGIADKKIHVSYLAAGDRLASNATAQGRALNRRVEIETVGVDTRDLRDDNSSNVMGRL